MYASLLLGLTVHEFAHAWSASLLGDDLARRLGRVSLNPLRHLSLMGTVAMFVIRFGWGKPVPVNLYNFRHPNRDYLITSLAGPAANVAMVVLSLLLMVPLSHTYSYGPGGQAATTLAYELLRVFIYVNALLAVLNLLPIPPLDGSKIWPCLVPRLRPTFNKRLMIISIVALIVIIQSDGLNGVYKHVIAYTNRLMPVSDHDRINSLWIETGRLVHSKDFKAAEETCTEALAIHPQSHETLRIRALVRISLGKFQDAVDDAQEAVRLRPEEKAYVETLDMARRSLESGTQPATDEAVDVEEAI